MAFNLREIFKALADAEVDYVMVGGLAVIMHGHLRATRDLDLVIGLEPANCAKGMEALANIGLRPRLLVGLADFADPATREDRASNRNMLFFQLWDPANPERSRSAWAPMMDWLGAVRVNPAPNLQRRLV